METTCSNGLETSTLSTEKPLFHLLLKPQIAFRNCVFPQMIVTPSELTEVPCAPAEELAGGFEMVGRGRQRVEISFLLLNRRETIDGWLSGHFFGCSSGWSFFRWKLFSILCI